MAKEYRHPEVLVSTDWVAEHAGDSFVRLVEVDVDTSSCDEGHIAGAVAWNWNSQLTDQVKRDLVTPDEFGKYRHASWHPMTRIETAGFCGDNR